MTAPVLDPSTTDAAPAALAGWRGPILPINHVSGDSRWFTLVGDDVPIRPLPLPLSAQYKLDDAHKGSVVVGVITRAWVQDDAVWAEGVFDMADPKAADWAGKLARGMAGWVSADLSDIEVTEVPLDADGNDITAEFNQWLVTEPAPGQPMPPDPVASWQLRYDQWKIMGVTLLSSPAFEDARIAPAADVVAPALTAAAESGEEHTGAMIALIPAAEDAARLAVEGGEPVEELHCTLAYLGEAAEWSDAQRDAVITAVTELAPSGPVLGEVWGHASFNPDGEEPCAVYLVGADGLADLRSAVLGSAREAGPVPEQHDTFVPHVTAGYGLPAAELVETGPLRFDRLRIAFAGGYEDIPLEPVTSALTAGAAVFHAADFEVPEPDELTALTITDDGLVYGHLAEWGTCHIGYRDCVSPPTSASDYAYFHQGEIRTDTGPLAVGKITLGTGHASMHASARAAAAHYDNTGSVVAVVRCRDGALGPWFSGRVLPGTSDERIDELRRSGVSGDWRGVRRGSDALELVAVLAVNVPGFPVPRTRALAASGVRSLVAAGMVHRRRTPATPERRLLLTDLHRRKRLGLAATRIRAVRAESAAARIRRAALTREK